MTDQNPMSVEACTPAQLQIALNVVVAVVHSYVRGDSRCGSVDWADVDAAVALAETGFPTLRRDLRAILEGAHLVDVLDDMHTSGAFAAPEEHGYELEIVQLTTRDCNEGETGAMAILTRDGNRMSLGLYALIEPDPENDPEIRMILSEDTGDVLQSCPASTALGEFELEVRDNDDSAELIESYLKDIWAEAHWG